MHFLFLFLIALPENLWETKNLDPPSDLLSILMPICSLMIKKHHPRLKDRTSPALRYWESHLILALVSRLRNGHPTALTCLPGCCEESVRRYTWRQYLGIETIPRQSPDYKEANNDHSLKFHFSGIFFKFDSALSKLAFLPAPRVSPASWPAAGAPPCPSQHL